MRRIKKIAVLGSGIMGTGIACHMANIGFDVLLLDMVPKNLTPEQNTQSSFRNSLASQALKAALKAKPAPLYTAEMAKKIAVGNFDDDLKNIADCDWIIEVVIERLDIKQIIFEKVDQFRKPGSLVSSNTSGIPIHMMTTGRSDDFKSHFLGTHFFNPARYLKLLEIIPTQSTDQSVVDFFMDFGRRYLGKETVLCKDTPAFIGNRIGVTSMAKIFELTSKLGLSIQDVDILTGPAIARPNTGTFRLGDLVGLDTAYMVLSDLQKHCSDDKALQQIQIPAYLKHLVEQKHLGNKTGKGFYFKTKERDEKGRSIIHGLNLETLEYEASSKSGLESLSVSKQISNPVDRIKALWSLEDTGAELIRQSITFSFLYSAQLIPEISDNIYGIDDAMKAGFAWSYGPFEYADILGVKTLVEYGKKMDLEIPSWVNSFITAGHEAFYTIKDHSKWYYDIDQQSYQIIPGSEGQINLNYFKGESPVFENEELRLLNIGDGVLNVEFISKSNTIGEGILKGLHQCIQIAEDGDWAGIVIANEGKNFTVGANLLMIGSLAFQNDYNELDAAVKLFQDTSMALRLAKVPVVAATQGYVFGGGCEFVMHTDSTIAAAESYIGLVEVGVGIIPGGGGSKEFALRAYDEYKNSNNGNAVLLEWFQTIAMGKVSTSAHEAIGLGYLSHKDRVVVGSSERIRMAKQRVLELAYNYIAPSLRTDIKVLGKSGIATLELALNEMLLGRWASEHDVKIAKKIAYVLSGGDISEAQAVDEQYLLDIEREAFLSLCSEPKTLARIQHMLETKKPLRN
ncbi:3-hydroxyacyl-CoA dehydrogenase/enoyl-CoA hydratase family protein [Membranihabitans marinus]|uniref:3-hydroxyacyl-CoA dehydrogenase/enoyl-CoA hydratase family protein n=1 Tax=Membranihabitans marinus TaxID=1227546 RepID=UPI001F16B9BC|nr:3-hydroxyacyl-CoA dehydrogenase/enoyl-CoA hydratase family protein [Membranihabitans marinus]